MMYGTIGEGATRKPYKSKWREELEAEIAKYQQKNASIRSLKEINTELVDASKKKTDLIEKQTNKIRLIKAEFEKYKQERKDWEANELNKMYDEFVTWKSSVAQEMIHNIAAKVSQQKELVEKGYFDICDGLYRKLK